MEEQSGAAVAAFCCVVSLLGLVFAPAFGDDDMGPEPAGTAAHDAGGAEACEVTVAAFDLGSATTKMQVAVLDRCEHRIVRRLDRGALPVGYGNDVADDGAIAPTTLEAGVAAIAQLSGQAAKFTPTQLVGVATEALRRADNGEEVLESLHDRTGVDLRFVSQLEEASLGFWAATESAGVEPQHAVVWDVGGESMELSASVSGDVVMHGIAYASGDMRRDLVTAIQHKPEDASPNPVSAEEALAARTRAAQNALGKVPGWLRTRLADPRTTFLGIGALQYYGDRGAQSTQCSRGGLASLLAESLAHTDDEIGGPYARGRVSDLTLFLGVMDALNVEAVRIADVDLTDGILISALSTEVSE